MYLLQTGTDLIINKAAFIAAVILSLLGILKAWKDWVNGEVEKSKDRYAADVEKERLRVELEKAKLETEVKIAQETSSGKTAIANVTGQVSDIIEEVKELQEKVEKCEGENQDLKEAVNKIDTDLRGILKDMIQHYYQNQTAKGRGR